MPSSNPLYDLLPARARQVLYAILFLVALAFSIWQASEGDWWTFVGSLVAALLGLLAAGNTETNIRP